MVAVMAKLTENQWILCLPMQMTISVEIVGSSGNVFVFMRNTLFFCFGNFSVYESRLNLSISNGSHEWEYKLNTA